MTSPLLAAAFSILTTADPVDLGGKLVGFGVASTVRYLVVTGVFRLAREVTAAAARPTEARGQLLRAVDTWAKGPAGAEGGAGDAE